MESKPTGSWKSVKDPMPAFDRLLPSSALSLAVVSCLFAQTAARQPPPVGGPQEAVATFKSKVNLVMVPVVVRDREGRAAGGLGREDFQLFDKGKPQVISAFSVEEPGSPVAVHRESSAANTARKPPAAAAPPSIPSRYIAYLFDDIHLRTGDLMRVRDAAGRHMSASLQATDRAAIFTTSARTTLDFTDDRAKLQETLLRLTPQSITRSPVPGCPDVSYYQAHLILNLHDAEAAAAAKQEALLCMQFGGRDAAKVAEQMARMAANHALAGGDVETHQSLAVVTDAIRRLSVMPGTRSIILASPGFLAPFTHDKGGIMDHAIRSNVVISALDARGLYAGGTDASRPSGSIASARIKAQYEIATAQVQADVLAEFAAGTGGTFYHNNNDLDEGFKQVAALPEYLYILGFSPQSLKLDGRYHDLKVIVKSQSHLSVEARRGYYAPKFLASAEDQGNQEIATALYSRQEMREIPAEMHTQVVKSSAATAKLDVLVNVDIRQMSFRKEEGQNRNDLMVAWGLFDRNGNYVTGDQRRIEMRLRDETLRNPQAPGVTVKTSFNVKPGSYLIRLVMRDAEGQMMTAQNSAVEIP